MKRSLKVIAKVIAPALMLAAIGSRPMLADTVSDTFSFAGLGTTAMLTVPSSPTPSSYVNGVSFTLPALSAYVDGSVYTGAVTFYTVGGASGEGAMFGGDKLFSGPTSAPTFLLGSFSLSGTVDFHDGDGPSPVSGRLTISQASPVPEPSTLLLMGTGVLGAAGAVRRRLLAARS